MGLVALQLKDWIEADEHFYDELKKKTIINIELPRSFCRRPGSLLAQTEVLALVLKHMKNLSWRPQIEEDEVILPKLKWKFRISDFESPVGLMWTFSAGGLCLMAPGPMVTR